MNENSPKFIQNRDTRANFGKNWQENDKNYKIGRLVLAIWTLMCLIRGRCIL